MEGSELDDDFFQIASIAFQQEFNLFVFFFFAF
jgi:hypothetical protein